MVYSKEEALRQIDESASRQHHTVKSANDRPGDISSAIEGAATQMFGDSTECMTGHRWDWEDSCEEIRNIWRLKAFKIYGR